MESMLLGPLKAKPDEPVPPVPWRGKRSRGGGYAALMPTIDEFFGTSNQVCGGFWPFGTDMALPAEGVPVGRSLMTGAGVCCDPISWFNGRHHQTALYVPGSPAAIGKSTFVRREVLGLSALGMNAIIPGDLKPTTPHWSTCSAARSSGWERASAWSTPWTPATSTTHCNNWRARRART